jgi:rhamnosyltransferase subunit B
MPQTSNTGVSDAGDDLVNHDNAPLIIICTSGTSGDITPFVTLGRWITDRGHQVVIFLPKFHESMVSNLGISYHFIDKYQEFESTLNNPDLWNERKGLTVVWNGLSPNLEVMSEFVRNIPKVRSCIILCHPTLVPTAAIARAIREDLRIVCAYLAPSIFCSIHDLLTIGSLRIPSWFPKQMSMIMWRLGQKIFVDSTTLPSLNAIREKHKLPAVRKFFQHMFTAPDASVGLFPSWYASTQSDWPQYFTECDFIIPSSDQMELSPELEQFLLGPPPIVFTPGTGHRHAEHYFKMALNTLIRLGRRGVFITPYREQLPKSLPAYVIWQAHVPFSTLLPRAAAVVHHGGIGTTAEAFRAGIPQLIVPYAYDQFDNGIRAKRFGVAEVLLAKHLSIRRMHKKLDYLLSSNDVIKACMEVRERSTEKKEVHWLINRVEEALFRPS